MTTISSLTEQNRATVEAVYAALIRGDVGGFLSFLTDDVVIDEPPYLPYGAVYRGKQVFPALFDTLVQYLDVSQITLHYTVADGDRVVGCLDISEISTGKPLHLLEQMTLRDGKVAEVKIFYYDAGTLIEKPRVV